MRSAIRKLVVKGEYAKAWKLKSVVEAIANKDHVLRCKDCHGGIRLHDRNIEHGPKPHAEHLVREDSEYCLAGHYFRRAKMVEPRAFPVRPSSSTYSTSFSPDTLLLR